ncbi:MAG: TIGR04086 family membrane protein [Clostridia bacterium]|nr:TIGR04086 family membrane protein [Clostridia bacterium]
MKNTEYKSLPDGTFFSGGLGGLLKGLLVSSVLTLILLSISALIITYTPISEDTTMAFSIICVIISALIGGMTASKNARKRGFLRGGAVGGLYIFVLYIIASLVSEKFSLSAHTALLFLIGIVSGAFGGIVGINTGYKRKR